MACEACLVVVVQPAVQIQEAWPMTTWEADGGACRRRGGRGERGLPRVAQTYCSALCMCNVCTFLRQFQAVGWQREEKPGQGRGGSLKRQVGKSIWVWE